jgi:hypothetical protein
VPADAALRHVSGSRCHPAVSCRKPWRGEDGGLKKNPAPSERAPDSLGELQPRPGWAGTSQAVATCPNVCTFRQDIGATRGG